MYERTNEEQETTKYSVKQPNIGSNDWSIWQDPTHTKLNSQMYEWTDIDPTNERMNGE